MNGQNRQNHETVEAVMHCTLAGKSFLKILNNVLLVMLTHIINIPFDEGCVPAELKMALIIPLLKKLLLDPDNFKNVHPMSNCAHN